MEKWLDIPNYPGYQVSDLGNVRTFNKITYKNNIKRLWKNRILKQKMSTNKYNRNDYRVDLWNNGKPKTYLVARLVAFTFYNKDINNSKLTINHINGNSLDNRLSNLEIIDIKSNIQHGFKTGLYDSFQKQIKVINKENNSVNYYKNLSNASKYIGKNKGYLSGCIIKNKFENKDYKWELI